MASMYARMPYPTTMDGGSAGFASLHGCNLLGQRICTGRTVLGQCRSYCRGAVAEEQKLAMRHTVSGNRSHFMPLTVNGAAVIVND